jgi:heat-inducible transcriptional repressor
MTPEERRAAILRAVVEEYIRTAQPVGSSHVSADPSIAVSSATVRNDMVQLEAEGYLHQPHTSAGRVPTEKGYRFFVDQLEQTATGLGAGEARRVRDFFAQAHGELELMLARTSRLLTDLTDYTAVVVSPDHHEVATVRSVQLVGLAPRVALLVVVLSDGAVEKRTLELDREVDDGRLAAAANRLAADLTGRSLADRPALLPTGDAATDDLARQAFDALGQPVDHRDHVYVDGASRMAAAFDAIDQVSEVLQILEQQLIVVSLLHDVLDRGLSVAIGTETGIEPLADCSIVVAPYLVEGEPVGSIGVLGPTRMNYPQALAAVAVVSQRLGNRLSEG